MDWVNLNYKLSHINNLLDCTNTALEGVHKKQSASDILIDFGSNLTGGALRNEIAYDIKHSTGSNLGIAINDAAGYGSRQANQKGMQDLMGASLFTGMFGGMGCCNGMYGGFPMTGGCYPMGGGYPMFGGGMTYTSPGLLGGMYDGTMLPTSRVPAPAFGTTAFNTNAFFRMC